MKHAGVVVAVRTMGVTHVIRALGNALDSACSEIKPDATNRQG